MSLVDRITALVERVASEINGTKAALIDKQDKLEVPAQAEAEAGTSTTVRAWTSQRIRQNANASDVGVGQTWKDMSGSRTVGVAYQNTTGKPIIATIYATQGNNETDMQVSMNGSSWLSMGKLGHPSAWGTTITLIIPPLWFYRVQRAFNTWMELR